ncbi:unnamed protein product [Rotaria sp. Silwood2]|nr:unnamed protein product [Rotaria sp. Silwood2]
MIERIIPDRFFDAAKDLDQALTHIEGDEKYRLVSLTETIEPIKSLLYNADSMVEKAEGNFREPTDGLTSDELGLLNINKLTTTSCVLIKQLFQPGCEYLLSLLSARLLHFNLLYDGVISYETVQAIRYNFPYLKSFSACLPHFEDFRDAISSFIRHMKSLQYLHIGLKGGNNEKKICPQDIYECFQRHDISYEFKLHIDTCTNSIHIWFTPERFHYELPFVIHSLLSQTQLPKQIRIYLSSTLVIIRQKNLTLRHLKTYIKRLDSSKITEKLFNKLLQIRWEEEDYDPTMKFLPIIKEFQSKSQAIMICDDDQYYHPYTLATLNKYSTKYENSIIGLRDWRVREDLIWSLEGKYEIGYHVIESHYLSEVYRVGVLTANHGYLIRSSFFYFHIYQDFNQVSDDIRHVDDIWLNGQASKLNIPRYVIPSCCSHIEVT